jgi:hypothetical protein
VLSQAPAATTASAAGWTETAIFTGAALVAVWITRRRAPRMEEHQLPDIRKRNNSGPARRRR